MQVILLAILALVLAACSTPDHPTSPTPGPAVDDPSTELTWLPDQHYGPADGLPIAIITARSGIGAGQNVQMYDVARFAVDEINARGGVLGQALRLLEYDNGTTPLGAKAAAERALADGAVVVIGCSRSSNSLSAARILQAAGRPMVSPESTNPDVTQIGDYIFRTCFIDSFQGQVLAAFARDHLKAETAVCLTNANRLFSTGMSTFFSEAFIARGGTILWNGEYLDSAADFERLVLKLRELKPDVVFIPSESRDAGFIVKQASAAGIDTQWLGPDSWNDQMYTYGGDHVSGGFFSSHWHPDSDSPASRAFVQAYTATGADFLRGGSAMWYDTVHVVADAITRAGSTDPQAIRDALTQTDYQGVTGRIHFDANGDPIDKPAVILQLHDNGSRFHTIVKP